MRQPREIGWFCVVAALVASGPQAVSAQEVAIPPVGSQPIDRPATSSDELNGGATPERFLFYSGFDLWHFGYAGYAGAQWAPRSLNSDGFVLSLFMSEGVERFDTTATRYRTSIFRAAVLPGWRFKRGKLEVKIFAGPDFEYDRFSPAPTYAKPSHSSVGARATVDLWWEPTLQMMVSASASATTIANGYSSRIAAGVRVLDACWIGPEVSASADRFSEQYRVGIHLTGLRTAALEWSLAAGYVQDSFQRNGIYGRIGVLARR